MALDEILSVGLPPGGCDGGGIMGLKGDVFRGTELGAESSDCWPLLFLGIEAPLRIVESSLCNPILRFAIIFLLS